MPKSSPPRSQQRAEAIDVTYETDHLFGDGTSKINLIDEGDHVEVVVSDIPSPRRYNEPGGDRDEIKEYAVGNWLLEDAAEVLERYGEWYTSNHRSRQRHRYLSDVYFTCDRSEVDDAVMDARKFLTALEAQVVRHHRYFDYEFRDSPSEDLAED